MWVFTEVADWFDKARQDNEKWIDSELQPWVATTLYDSSPWYRNVGVWAAAGTLYSLNKFTTTVASGFVDVLRVGDGVKEGGWGYGKDALRVLMLAGPALRSLRWAAALVPAVDETQTMGNCTWIAATRMARWTGVKPLATLGDVARAQGLSGIGETGGAYADELLPAFKNLGVRARLLNGELQSVDDLASTVRNNPNGTTLFSVQWKMGGNNVGHSLFAVRNIFRGMTIVDRSGRAVRSLAELEDLYPGIGKASLYGTAIVVDNSGLVTSLGTLPTLANTLGAAAGGNGGTAGNRSSDQPAGSPSQPGSGGANAPAGGGGKGANTVTPGTLTVTSNTICVPPNSDVLQPSCAPTVTKTYKVGQGESLSLIALRVYGDASKWQSIASANGIKPPKYVIHPGQVLLIP